MFWQTEAHRLGGCPGRSFAVALVVALLVSGCSSESGDSDEQAADQPSASQATKSQPDTSRKTEGKDPKPSAPTLPGEAKGDSVKAAEAFVEHYIELLNYSLMTGETRELNDTSLGNCSGCRDYVRFIRKIYDSGGFYKTQEWMDVDVRPGSRGESIIFTVSAIAPRVTYRMAGSGKVKRAQKQAFDFAMGVREVGGRWRASDIFSS
ncbi:MAG: DUF6318 family protein [Actinomycetota bacterium]|nr:DUF6318 family protein [Actinomycetota bacterium]